MSKKIIKKVRIDLDLNRAKKEISKLERRLKYLKRALRGPFLSSVISAKVLSEFSSLLKYSKSLKKNLSKLGSDELKEVFREAEKLTKAFEKDSELIKKFERNLIRISQKKINIKTDDRDLNKLKKELSDLKDKKRIRISADTSRALSSISRLRQKLKEIKAPSMKIGVGSLAGMAAGAFSVYELRELVKLYGSFSDELRMTQALLSLNEEGYNRLKEAAIQAGATTAFTTSQAAHAMRILAQAGKNVDEIISSLPTLLSFASASMMSLPDAASVALDVSSQFSLSFFNLAETTDKLVKSATIANTTVSQLGIALSYVGPMASALGMSLDEVLTYLDLLAEAGIRGERGGTGLRRILARLVGPTGEAKEALRSMGIELEDVSGKLKPLKDILYQLREAQKKAFSDGKVREFSASLKTIFGVQAVSSIEALIRRVNDFDEKLSRIREKSEGVTSIVAQKREGDVGGSIRQLNSAIEALKISLTDLYSPAVKSGLSGLAEMFRTISKTIRSIPQRKDLLDVKEDLVRGGELMAGVGLGAMATASLAGVSAAPAVAGLGVVGLALAKYQKLRNEKEKLRREEEELKKVDLELIRLEMQLLQQQQRKEELISGNLSPKFEALKEFTSKLATSSSSLSVETQRASVRVKKALSELNNIFSSDKLSPKQKKVFIPFSDSLNMIKSSLKDFEAELSRLKSIDNLGISGIFKKLEKLSEFQLGFGKFREEISELTVGLDELELGLVKNSDLGSLLDKVINDLNNSLDKIETDISREEKRLSKLFRSLFSDLFNSITSEFSSIDSFSSLDQIESELRDHIDSIDSIYSQLKSNVELSSEDLLDLDLKYVEAKEKIFERAGQIVSRYADESIKELERLADKERKELDRIKEAFERLDEFLEKYKRSTGDVSVDSKELINSFRKQVSVAIEPGKLEVEDVKKAIKLYEELIKTKKKYENQLDRINEKLSRERERYERSSIRLKELKVKASASEGKTDYFSRLRDQSKRLEEIQKEIYKLSEERRKYVEAIPDLTVAIEQGKEYLNLLRQIAEEQRNQQIADYESEKNKIQKKLEDINKYISSQKIKLNLELNSDGIKESLSSIFSKDYSLKVKLDPASLQKVKIDLMKLEESSSKIKALKTNKSDVSEEINKLSKLKESIENIQSSDLLSFLKSVKDQLETVNLDKKISSFDKIKEEVNNLIEVVSKLDSLKLELSVDDESVSNELQKLREDLEKNLKELQEYADAHPILLRVKKEDLEEFKEVYPIKKASGGLVPGFGSTDSVPALLTPGEFVIRKDVVNKLGVSFLSSLNAGSIPSVRETNKTTFVLEIGDKSYPMQTSEDVIERLRREQRLREIRRI